MPDSSETPNITQPLLLFSLSTGSLSLSLKALAAAYPLSSFSTRLPSLRPSLSPNRTHFLSPPCAPVPHLSSAFSSPKLVLLTAFLVLLHHPCSSLSPLATFTPHWPSQRGLNPPYKDPSSACHWRPKLRPHISRDSKTIRDGFLGHHPLEKGKRENRKGTDSGKIEDREKSGEGAPQEGSYTLREEETERRRRRLREESKGKNRGRRRKPKGKEAEGPSDCGKFRVYTDFSFQSGLAIMKD